MAVVYIVVNILNGDRYIGVTNKTLNKRRNSHYQQAFGEKRNVHFHNALRKYGKEYFLWDVLAEYKTWEDALNGEIYFIDKLNPEYNMTKGGEGVIGIIPYNRKKVMCLEDGIIHESGESASKYYGVSRSEVTESCSNHARTNKVKGLHFIFSDEEMKEQDRIELIRERDEFQVSSRRRKQVFTCTKPFDNRYGSRSKKVICLDDGNIFPSISQAARFYGSSSGAITELCKGQKFRKTVNGRRFMYYVGKTGQVA